MDKNDPLSKQNKIPLGHNFLNGAVYSKINFKVEIPRFISRFIPRDNTAQT